MHSKRWKLAVLSLLLAVLLAGCLPEGGIFGHGGSSPRPEFAGSPMAGEEAGGESGARPPAGASAWQQKDKEPQNMW